MASSVSTIDCNYLKPGFACSYLLQEGRGDQAEATFVEANTSYAVPGMLEELKKRGMKPEQVRYLIVTHAHLDHSSGASALLQACPKATLLVHPRAARHLIDPSRLVASAQQVYGEKVFQELYGEVLPVPAERVRIMEDGEELSWGSRRLQFLHTRGHANHHFCVFDAGVSGSGGIFTGDSFGLAYPALQKNGLLIFPSSSPTDFDPIEAKKSVRRIAETGAKRAYLTHFGEVREVQKAAQDLCVHLDFYEKLLHQSALLFKKGESLENVTQACDRELEIYYRGILKDRGLGTDPETWAWLKMDLQLNAAGIAWSAQKIGIPKEEKS